MTLLIIAIVLIVAFHFFILLFAGWGESPDTKAKVAIGTSILTSIGLAYFFYKRCKKRDILGFKRFALVLLVPLFVPICMISIVGSIVENIFFPKNKSRMNVDFTTYNEYYVTIKLENGAKYNGAFTAKYDNLNGNAIKTGTFTIFNKTNGKGYNGYVGEIKSIKINSKVPDFDGRI